MTSLNNRLCLALLCQGADELAACVQSLGTHSTFATRQSAPGVCAVACCIAHKALSMHSEHFFRILVPRRVFEAEQAAAKAEKAKSISKVHSPYRFFCSSDHGAHGAQHSSLFSLLVLAQAEFDAEQEVRGLRFLSGGNPQPRGRYRHRIAACAWPSKFIRCLFCMSDESAWSGLHA